MYGFDLDETIYPEKEHALGCFRTLAYEASTRAGEEPIQFCDYLEQHFHLEGRRNLIVEFLQHFNLGRVLSLEDAIAIYRDARAPIWAHSDALTFIQKCVIKGIKTILITDGNASVQRKKVALLNIETLFDEIYYTDDYGAGYEKPNRAIFELALRDYKVRPNEFTYIGDNPYKDFIGPKQLGSNTIRIKRGAFSNVKVREELDAVSTVESFNQIEEFQREK